MKIFIPTKGRLESQKTWDHIPEDLRSDTILICPPDEVERHAKLKRNAMAHPKGLKGISNVRQWILEQAGEKFIMIDDDHWFFRREMPGDVKLRKTTEQDMLWLFRHMDHLLNRFHHIGVSARQGNNRMAVPHVDVTRQNNMHGFRRETLLKHKIRFDTLPLMEDFHVTLSLLELGYPNRVITEICWNQSSGSHAKGGCSDYRTNELQREAAITLARLHRPFVKVIRKKSKSSWKGMEERFDVRVNWKAAYQSSMVTKGLLH